MSLEGLTSVNLPLGGRLHLLQFETTGGQLHGCDWLIHELHKAPACIPQVPALPQQRLCCLPAILQDTPACIHLLCLAFSRIAGCP